MNMSAEDPTVALRRDVVAEQVAALTDEQRTNRETWLRALESGLYRQGHGRLRVVSGDGGDVGYCCLGVAEDVRGCVWQSSQGTERPGEGESWTSLSDAGQDWLGVVLPDPRVAVVVRGSRTTMSLSTLNDNSSLTFQGIAKIIRAQGPDWVGSLEQSQHRAAFADELLEVAL